MAKVKCPACQHEITLEPAIEFEKESRLTLEVNVVPGNRMMAKTIGNMLVSFVKLTEAASRECGVKTQVALDGLEFDNGSVKAHFLMLNSVNPKVKP
jgi:hypothetical protein